MNHKSNAIVGQPMYLVLMEDPIIHTAANPYCNDSTCPCHHEEEEAPTPRGYAPDGSTEHDHLCRCPGCDYDGPDPTEEEIAAMELADRRAWLMEHL